MEAAMVVVGFLATAGYLAWASLRVLIAPEQAWLAGRSRWMVFVSKRRGERRPTATELRLWALVWFLIATAIAAFGIAVAFGT